MSERHDEVGFTRWSTYLCCCSGIGWVSLVAASWIISGQDLKCERIPNYSRLS